MTEEEQVEFYTKDEVDALLERTKKQATEDALKTLPFVLKSLIAQLGQVNEMRETFYKDHKDLAAHKELVTKVMEKVESDNPGMLPKDVLAQTVIESRRRLAQGKGFDMTPPEKPSSDKLNSGLDNLLGAFNERK